MWFLAIRQLLARRKQTLLVIGGILLGTAAYIAISGMMLGFQTYLIDRLVDSGGHIHVSPRNEDINASALKSALFAPDTLVSWVRQPSGRRDHARIEHPAGWFARLNEDPRVLGYSPQLTVQALAKRGSLSTAASVIGVDPARHERVTNINNYVAQTPGDAPRRLSEIGRSGNRIIVGKGLLAKLAAGVGETILLSVASGEFQPFRIVNTVELGVGPSDETMIFASLSDVQKLNRTPSQVSDILIRLGDVTSAADTARSLAAYSTDKVESWEQANQGILSVFSMQTMIRNLMSLSILLVAGFGIYNILNMIVSQKRKEIGILRSMGYTSAEVSKLFFNQGLIFGILGGAAGLAVGFLACKFMSTLHIGVPGSVSYRNLFVTFDWRIYAKAFGLALGSSVLAGWIPARGAGKLNPIEIIRSDGG